MKRTSLLVALMASSALVLSGCGTLTGIPGHGGGKRFVEEQRLVSASIRGSLEAIDVSALRGKRVAMIFSIIADEGGGNIVGGRASLGALLTAGTMVSPVTTRTNALEVYQLAGAGSSQANTVSAGSGANVAQVGIVGANTSNSVQVTAGPSVTTGSGQQTNSGGTSTSTTVSPQTTSNTTINNGATSTTQTTTNPAITTTGGSTTNANQTTSTTTTGGTTTNQTVNNPANTTTNNSTTAGNQVVTTINTNASSNTQNTTNSGGTTTTTNVTPQTTTNSTNSSSTTNPNVNTNTSGSNSSSQNSNGSNTSNSNQDQSGSTANTQEQVQVTGFTEQTSGQTRSVQAQLNYKGLGDYQVLSVPKSDASLLMSLTRNYFILNGIEVTTPQDPTADAIVYVTVDIFGTDRKRTDLIIYNNERLSAETSIEMFAADRKGRIIMRPSVGNIRTDYREDYILWAGPLDTRRSTSVGIGPMNDFTDQ